MSKTITLFIAKGAPDHKHFAGCYFEVEAQTLDEAREILIKDKFNGFLYEENYQLISTTPHIIASGSMET